MRQVCSLHAILVAMAIVVLTPWQAAAQDRRAQLNTHLRQAQIELDQENYGRVVEELQKALAIHDQIPGAYYQLGLAYFQLGNTQEAETAFLRELQFDPPDAHSLYYLGRIRLSYGETEKAIERFEQVLKIGTSSTCSEDLPGPT